MISFWKSFSSQIHPQKDSLRMTWGPNLDKPYLSFKLVHIWLVWTFLAKNKIGMLNFYFRDHSVPKFIPRRILWGWTGGPYLDKPYLSFKLAHIWFVWTFLQLTCVRLHIFPPATYLNYTYRHPLNFAVTVDIGDPTNIKMAKILT